MITLMIMLYLLMKWLLGSNLSQSRVVTSLVIIIVSCTNYQIHCYFKLQLLYYLKLKMIVDQPRGKWLFWMLFNFASKFSWKWRKLNGHNFFRFYNKIVWICYSLFCIMMTGRKTSKQQQTRQGEKRLKGKCRRHVVNYSIKVLIRGWYQFALQQNSK